MIRMLTRQTASVLPRMLLIGCFCLLAACGPEEEEEAGATGGANARPVVDAGADTTVVEKSVVRLVGAASDPDGDALTYAWSQTGGPAVTLIDADTAEAEFLAPDVATGTTETLTFMLTVDDGAAGARADDVVITVQEASDVVTLSGHARYEFPPPNNGCNGLDFRTSVNRPIRGATVQVISADTNALIASTVTDRDGFYSVLLDANIDVFVRVRSELKKSGAPSWDVDVRNNTVNTSSPLGQRPLYFLDSTVFNTTSVDPTLNLLAETGWTGSGYGEPRAAAPFAVLDTIYEMMQLVVSADPSASFPALDAFWSPDNNSSRGTGSFFDDIDSGDIGTSFYAGGSLTSLFLLGMDGDDAEEFDDHVIGHEWGHYFEDKFSRSDSIGGAHSIGNRLDKRVAFGEGFATALSGIGLDNPQYCDTLWVGSNLRGFEIDIEDEPNSTAGWFSETSVFKFLYDLWDDSRDGADTASIGFSPIFDVMTGPQRTMSAFTSIFSFVEALKAQPGADAAFIDGLLAQENVNASGINRWGEGETNDVFGRPDVLPVYTDIAVGGTARVCGNSQFDSARTGNKLSEVRYLRFDLPNSSRLTFAADTVDPPTAPDVGYDCTANAGSAEAHRHSDPDFQVWRNGQLVVQGLSCEPNRERARSGTLAAGTYVIDITDFRHADPETNTPGGFPEQICFDVTITP